MLDTTIIDQLFHDMKRVGVTVNFGMDTHGSRTCTARISETPYAYTFTVRRDHEVSNEQMEQCALSGLALKAIKALKP